MQRQNGLQFAESALHWFAVSGHSLIGSHPLHPDSVSSYAAPAISLFLYLNVKILLTDMSFNVPDSLPSEFLI